MEFQLNLDRSAKKSLKKFDKHFKDKIFSVISKIQNQSLQGKSLKGWEEKLFVVRAWPFRIIYQIDFKKNIVNVISIKHRKDVYKDLKNL